MQRVTQWKKTGSSLTPKWISLVLFGVLAGGIVLTGCGGGEAEDDTGTGGNNTAAAGGGEDD